MKWKIKFYYFPNCRQYTVDNCIYILPETVKCRRCVFRSPDVQLIECAKGWAVQAIRSTFFFCKFLYRLGNIRIHFQIRFVRVVARHYL